MNQTYKNLRAILHKHKENMPVIAVAELLAEIYEAEAKWEAECCEWKKSEVYGYIKNPHTGRIFSNEPSMQNVYCNTCGKPIKISEVE